MSAHIVSRLIFFLSVVDNFLLVLSVVSNIFHPLSLVDKPHSHNRKISCKHMLPQPAYLVLSVFSFENRLFFFLSQPRAISWWYQHYKGHNVKKCFNKFDEILIRFVLDKLS